MRNSSTYDLNSENAMSGEFKLPVYHDCYHKHLNLNKQGNIGYCTIGKITVKDKFYRVQFDN